MKILITGGTGFVGKALCKALTLAGHDLVVVTRDPTQSRLSIPAPHESVSWSDLGSKLEGVDAVIHLAGESIAGQRWSASYKEKLRKSRIGGTRQLISLLESIQGPKPQVFLSASAIGYYGDRGDDPLDEQSSPGADFLAELCQEWEKTLFESSLTSMRKVALRIGIVLGKGGGALEQMLFPFILGVGGPLGSGRQWMSWIHLDDLVAIIMDSLENKNISGPINCCSPEPVTNLVFTQMLAKSLHTWGVLKAPKAALRVALGEFAGALTSSQRVIPGKLIKAGFQFRFPQLDSALQSILGDSYSLGYSEFVSQCWIPKPIETVFRFFSEAKNLERITPPWLKFHILSQSSNPIQQGTQIDYRLKLHGIPLRWRSEIASWRPPYEFMDIQLKGPYQTWKHTHRFSELKGGTWVEDWVLYRIPLGYLGNSMMARYVQGDVSKIFAYRTQKISELLS